MESLGLTKILKVGHCRELELSKTRIALLEAENATLNHDIHALREQLAQEVGTLKSTNDRLVARHAKTEHELRQRIRDLEDQLDFMHTRSAGPSIPQWSLSTASTCDSTKDEVAAVAVPLIMAAEERGEPPGYIPLAFIPPSSATPRPLVKDSPVLSVQSPQQPPTRALPPRPRPMYRRASNSAPPTALACSTSPDAYGDVDFICALERNRTSSSATRAFGFGKLALDEGSLGGGPDGEQSVEELKRRLADAQGKVAKLERTLRQQENDIDQVEEQFNALTRRWADAVAEKRLYEATCKLAESMGSKIVRVMGEGSFGKVFLFELQNGDIRAVKAQIIMSKVHARMVEREYQCLTALGQSDCTPRVYERKMLTVPDPMDEESSSLEVVFIIMEALHKAHTIMDAVNHIRAKAGVSMTSDEVDATLWDLIIKICEAVRRIHACGILHKDVKPQNLLVDNAGKVYVIDLGLSQVIGDDGMCLDGGGTPEYMGPEVLAKLPQCFGADIWSVGIIIFELYRGTRPLRRKVLDTLIEQSRVNNVSKMELKERLVGCTRMAVSNMLQQGRPKLCEVVLRCLELNPAMRKMPEADAAPPL